ncbi:PrgI family protein [Patescibacteria group bacterium]|nr:PrgI family protein [Patescibacteria group bacterium]
MRFQVPQFIEVEDRIIGPFTITQFVYLAGGLGFLFALWLTLPLWAALLLGVPVAALGGALAFVQINNRPLITTLEHAFFYALKDKLYIWSKRTKSPAELAKEAVERTEDPSRYVVSPTSNKLKDIAWSLDIKESIYSDRNQR